MVLPLLPIIAGGALLGGGAGIGWGIGKKDGKIEQHAPYEYYAPTTSEVYAPTYAPQVQFAPVTSYGYQGPTTIISSPGAVAKKEQIMDVISKPEQTGSWELPLDISQEPTHAPGSGANITHIAIIAAVGLVALTILKKKK